LFYVLTICHMDLNECIQLAKLVTFA